MSNIGPAENRKPTQAERLGKKPSRLNRKMVISLILFALVLWRCYKVTFH